MQQQKRLSSRRSKSRNNTRFFRMAVFIGFFLAIVVTGVLVIITGATSTSSVMTGVLALLLGIAGVIQIYPIVVPAHATVTVTGAAEDGSTAASGANTIQGVSSQDGKPIFLFNLPLPNVNEYYGRVGERGTLIARIGNGGSSSIVGERRVGKTWLLTHVRLIAPTYDKPGSAYKVVYVSAKHPECRSVESFVQRVLEELKGPAHVIATGQPPLSRLSQRVRDLKNLGIVSVLCIDEFEGFDNGQEFHHDFFEGLRALTQDDGLVLITASRRPLREIIENMTGQTSPLFNIVQQITLRPFTEHEAEEFVRDKSVQAGFDEKVRKYFLCWGRLYRPGGESYWPPLRLQLVGQMLLDAAQETGGDQLGQHLDNGLYQSRFEQRLNEAYEAVVRQEHGR